MIDTKAYWTAVLSQDAEAMRNLFRPDAYVNWHNTNEHFTREEFIRANCEYPGAWQGSVERELVSGNTVITVTNVRTRDGSLSFHVTSFIETDGRKIIAIDEYWGDDGDAPKWRRDMGIGTAIV